MKVLIVGDSAIAGKRFIAMHSRVMKAEDTSYAEYVPRGDKVRSEAGSRCGDARFAHAYLLRSWLHRGI